LSRLTRITITPAVTLGALSCCFEEGKGLFIQRFYVKGRRTFDFSLFLPSDYACKRDETTKVPDSFRLTSDAK
jgi:hypothetical protein